MTVEELAKYLKIKPDTIYKKVRKGELPAVKLGKLLRFPKELIDQWIVEQAQKTMKAKEALTHKVEEVVEEVVDEVNKRAKVASKVMNEVPDLLDDVKKAALSDKSEVLKKGLKGLWSELKKKPAATPKKKKAKVAKGHKKVAGSKKKSSAPVAPAAPNSEVSTPVV